MKENELKISSKLKGSRLLDASVIRDRIRLPLFQATFNIEIANFGSTTFKIASIAEISKSSLKHTINLKKLEKLWKLGIVVLKGEKDVDDYFALFYKGKAVISAESEQMMTFLNKTIFKFGIKDAEITKILDDLLELVTKVRFSHIPSSGAIVNAGTKKGTYLAGSFAPDLQFILKQLDYPIIEEINELFPLLKGQNYNLLNVSDKIYKLYVREGGFFTNVNAKWVDSAVEKNLDIIIMSEFKYIRKIKYNEYGEKISSELTGFGKEIHRFEWQHGYRFDLNSNKMLPKENAKGLKTLTRLDENKL